MNPKSKIPFAESKQERSQKTLEDILQAANSLVDDANPELFTSRSLAQKSGYALGTLVRRLSSVENVFLWAIKQARERKFEELVLDIAHFDSNITINEFAEKMVEKGFEGAQKVNPKVMRYFENRITRRDGLTADYFAYLDCFVEPYLAAASKNKTDTFRQMPKYEAVLLIRQLCLLLERPFVEGNPIAGTDEHRRITREAIVRLLGK
jgi:hypothetical protein